MKRFLSILLAVMMVASLGSFVAFAADETDESTPLADAKMTKDLEVADGIDIKDVKSFTFSFTGADGTGTTATEANAGLGANGATQTITVAAQSGGHAYGKLALSDVFNIANFSHAGVYVYTVKETTEAITNQVDGDVTKNLTVDSSVYTVELYVKNGASGLEFHGVIVKKDGKKVDPTIEEGDISGFNFTNTYTEVINENQDGVLTVTKTITGDYADKTKAFPITVEITIPATASKDDVVCANEITPTWAENVGTFTVELADTDDIQFTKLPAGTTFTVSETQDDAYKSKITGYVATEDTALVAGNRTDIAGKGPIVEAGKTVTIENNRDDVIPTGVIINNLPYILLVVIAGGALAFMALKKKAYKA